MARLTPWSRRNRSLQPPQIRMRRLTHERAEVANARLADLIRSVRHHTKPSARPFSRRLKKALSVLGGWIMMGLFPPSLRALEGRVSVMASKSFVAGYFRIETVASSLFPVLASSKYSVVPSSRRF